MLYYQKPYKIKPYVAFFFFLFSLTLFGFIAGKPSAALAQTQTNSLTHINLEVYDCNNNGICEPQFGENYLGCPMDCPAPTSTPPPPPPPGGGVAPPSGGGGNANPTIIPNSIMIRVTAHSAIISWSTYGESLGLLSWGESSDTELGTISEINYGINHQIELDGLDAATRYLFRIELRDRLGHSSFFGTASFYTLPEVALPLNVSNFHFTIQNSQVLLSWRNPKSANFQSVRLLRSSYFFPGIPDNGQVLYEGSGNSYLDNDVKVNQDYYYTIFAEDKDGTFSSGAVLHLRLRESGTGSPPVPGGLPGFPPLSELADTISPSDINIEQNGQSILFLNHLATVVTDLPITFSLLFNPSTNGIQSVVISVEDENNPGLYHSYLLRENSSSTLEAIIPSFQKSGTYQFSLDVLDGVSSSTKHLSGAFLVKNRPILSSINSWWILVAYIIAFLIIFLLLLELFRRLF